MIQRNIYNTLMKWENDTTRKPILLRGARQIGKTFIVEHFAKNEFLNSITINFERNPEFKDVFTINDPVKIIEQIELLTKEKISLGKTLLFLDEIQECPQAIVTLRYFYEEIPTLHIIGAGSLLEFTLLAENFSLPVGRIQYVYMYPLSFSEFLVALGYKQLQAYVSNEENLSKISDSLHDKLLEQLRLYFILGGMPEVVSAYIKNKSIIACQKIQRSIVDTYQDDFSKYASQIKFKHLKKIFSAVPAMVGNKFVYSKVDPDTKSRELKDAMNLLETAGIIYRARKTSGAGIPLESHAIDRYFKVLFLDIGLMQSINGMGSEIVLGENLTDIYKGALAEQFVGQELLAYSSPYHKENLYYWTRDQKNSSAEIDYLIQKYSRVVPIEVKSGSTGRMKSMILYKEAYHPEQAIKISQAPYNDQQEILELPLYAIEYLMKPKKR
ncbi:MAG: ATP-binding protein [Candidatus Marinimicrobia bacterium]|nr:ATP-binding protein [Candidatus Neomarinimicrobiota bacterium]